MVDKILCFFILKPLLVYQNNSLEGFSDGSVTLFFPSFHSGTTNYFLSMLALGSFLTSALSFTTTLRAHQEDLDPRSCRSASIY